SARRRASQDGGVRQLFTLRPADERGRAHPVECGMGGTERSGDPVHRRAAAVPAASARELAPGLRGIPRKGLSNRVTLLRVFFVTFVFSWLRFVATVGPRRRVDCRTETRTAADS